MDYLYRLQQSPIATVTFALGILTTYLVVRLALNFFTPGLSQYPGDFLGKITNGWRLWKMYRSTQPAWVLSMMKKYNTNAVRVGPNVVYLSDPAAVDIIYGMKDDYIKSRQVDPWMKMVGGKVYHGLADTLDKKAHSTLRRPIQNTYNMSSIMPMEGKIDDVIKLFVERVDEAFIKTGQSCDIDNWLQYFAYDVVGEVTLSRRFGFLAKGADVDGMLHDLDVEFYYRALVGQMPWIDKWIDKNPLYIYLFAPTSKFTTQAFKMMAERFQDGVGGKHDFLDRFVEAKEKHPDLVNDQIIATYVAQNLLAGSDTTGVVLRSAIYYLARNPTVLAKLREELDSSKVQYPMSYTVAQSLPYVDGVIRESWRMHPIGGFFNERIVPEAGLELSDGKKIPRGTVVGMSPHTLNFEPSLYGPLPVSEFRPERWMQSSAETAEEYNIRRSRMLKSDLTFMRGPRNCIGQNLAKMELYKLVATVAGLLDWELVHPEREWKVTHGFFAKQTGMDMVFRWREGVSGEMIMGRWMETAPSLSI